MTPEKLNELARELADDIGRILGFRKTHPKCILPTILTTLQSLNDSWEKQVKDLEAAAIGSVLSIRCTKHIGVRQINSTEFSGGECGACIQEDRVRLAHSAALATERVKYLAASQRRDALEKRNAQLRAERDQLARQCEALKKELRRIQLIEW